MVLLQDDVEGDKEAFVADKYGDIYKLKYTSATLETTMCNYYC